ncbi:MAG: hypothetical protein KatS3mg104_2934 [Phycisphaerae bacterium]|nr:MAG: hypothetical protein KatS3mg104_2934 [Phycisphaerae bacterium]
MEKQNIFKTAELKENEFPFGDASIALAIECARQILEEEDSENTRNLLVYNNIIFFTPVHNIIEEVCGHNVDEVFKFPKEDFIDVLRVIFSVAEAEEDYVNGVFPREGGEYMEYLTEEELEKVETLFEKCSETLDRVYGELKRALVQLMKFMKEQK